jgi:hypothetical protein
LALLRAVSTADAFTAELAVDLSGRDQVGDLLDSFGHDTSLPSVVGGPPTTYRVGAENRVTSCDLHILVDEAAESVSAEHADGRPATWRGVACGRALIQ